VRRGHLHGLCAQSEERAGFVSDCPFFRTDAADVHQEAVPGPFSNFEQVADAREKEAIALEFRITAEVTDCRYETRDGIESMGVRMLNRDYILQRNGLYERDLRCRDVRAKIILCDYLRRRGTQPLTGDLITLGHFSHTASHVKAFQGNAENKISDRFSKDLHRLKQRCPELGGIETAGRVKADFNCRCDLLPHVQLFLSFWQADEEFDADCKLLFDRSASDHIDIEYLACLIERFVEELTGA